MALFVSGEAYTDPVIKGAAKMGAMFSLVSAIAGILVARILKVRKLD